jgi:SAM-dependent methyltransferase
MTTPFTTEESRIKSVYAKRDAGGKRNLYAWHRQEVLLNTWRFRSFAAAVFVLNGMTDLSRLEALDVGCGTGGWLRTLMEWGASPENLHGIDLLEDRVERAKVLCPGIDLQIGSGYEIPYPSESMDLVSAHTVFSSILDGAIRKSLAQEMVRVVKPAGAVFIYDYRISDPRNPDTIGIRKKEIQRLFPEFQVNMRSLTLAPPLARRIAPVSPLLAHAMEAWFPFLRTHALYFLKK